MEQIAKLIDPEYLRWWREKELVYYRSLFEFLSKGALPNEARCLAGKEQEIWLAENLTPVLQKYPELAPLYR